MQFLESESNNKSIYDKTSSTGFSQPTESEYREDVNMSQRGIDNYANNLKKKYAFGSSIKRFDSKQDLKKEFNTEPGPGSYMNNDTTNASRNHNISSMNSYSLESINSESQNKAPGFGTGDERFKEDFTKLEAQSKPGPGSYEYKLPQKCKGGLINPKPSVALNFNENNPLNYVRPITVNLYFKQDVPPVGKYNIEKPFGSDKNNICKVAFKAQNKRMEITNNNPAPNTYDVNKDAENFKKSKNVITSSFKSPVRRKIYPVNLYDPHKPVSPKFKMPGPGHYQVQDIGTIKEKTAVDAGSLNSVKHPKLTSVFIEENTDRFGRQIYPTKLIESQPGPSEYHTENMYKVKTKGFSITTSKRELFGGDSKPGKPHVGPGAYNSNVEPKKISFFLNQGDKWVV